tara:strand:+ start:51 stop:1337 length:1287 start_codon:yes stop_codon:yes gene_type:complete
LSIVINYTIKAEIKREMIYLVLGNHNTLSGVWEQVEITLRTFKEMDLNISISSRIKPGEVNILIEDFSSNLVDSMLKIKANNPETKYILYVTEYLTQAEDGNFFLNCFNKKSILTRKIFNIEYKLCGDIYNVWQGGDLRSKLKNKIRNFVAPFMHYVAKASSTNYGNELMMARRQLCLDQVRELFSLCISTTEAVLNGYNTYCDCPLKYLPVFIDEKRVKSNRRKAHHYPAIFFSGRLTPHRKRTSIIFGKKLLNGYPLESGAAWQALIKDTKFKLDRLEKETEIFGKSAPKRLANEIRQFELPAFDILKTAIYEYTKKNKQAAYEIYIPQSDTWPYSSPNRTVLSIESGFIPIDYGKFSDHDINKVAITAHNTDNLNSILSGQLDTAYKELDVRIFNYNNIQGAKIPVVKEAILALCSESPATWDKN